MRDIVDTSGNELDHIVYDSFGNILSESAPTGGDRFKFAGMEYDAAMGQYYDHARNLDAVAGRFISTDPMGFAGGNADLYAYLGNAPTDGVDTTGLFPDDPKAPKPPVGTTALSAEQKAHIAELMNELQKLTSNVQAGSDFEKYKPYFQAIYKQLQAMTTSQIFVVTDPDLLKMLPSKAPTMYDPETKTIQINWAQFANMPVMRQAIALYHEGAHSLIPVTEGPLKFKDPTMPTSQEKINVEVEAWIYTMQLYGVYRENTGMGYTSLETMFAAYSGSRDELTKAVTDLYKGVYPPDKTDGSPPAPKP